MSQRLTQKWTKKLEHAYGANGAKGERGELMVLAAINSWTGWMAEHHPDDYAKQVAGIDIEFRKTGWSRVYTADVKANIKNEQFYVELDPLGWLKNPNKTSDRIWHIDVDTGVMAWYDRHKMIDHLTCGKYIIPFNRYINCAVFRKGLPDTSFIRWSKI